MSEQFGKKNMKKLIIIGLALAMAIRMSAVVANPHPVVMDLGDGVERTVIIHGDEYHSYITDLQGNILQGSIPTAEEAHAIQVRRITNQKKVGSNFPLTGSPKSVVILLDFKDVHFTYSRQYFEDLVNKSGFSENGATGSCRDYFIACSDSLFIPQFDVYGPYEVSRDMAYYGKHEGAQHDAHATEAFIEAANLAEQAGVDFSQYDADGDGIIDNIFFFYAGKGEADGGGAETIWPHSSNVSYKQIYLSGKLFATYACSEEIRWGNQPASIGTFCHEFGHVLGLPDWYDTDYGVNDYTVGEWSIMASGCYNNSGHTPPSYSCYERFYLHWLKPEQLQSAGRYYLKPLNSANEAYIIADGYHNLSSRQPSPSEFFMLEYRTKTGWDAPWGAIPGEGMLVWHIDFSASAWSGNTPNNGTPMRYHLEEAGGCHGMSLPSDPYPGTRNITKFTPTLHNGEVLSSQPVFEIEEKNSMIDFIYQSEGEDKLNIFPSELHLVTPINDKGKVDESWMPERLYIIGDSLEVGDDATIEASGDVYLSMDTNAVHNIRHNDWRKKYNLSSCINSEGKIDTFVYVSYRSTKVQCEDVPATLSIKFPQSGITTTVPVTSMSPRPNYLKDTEFASVDGVSPYGFTLHWDDVYDAEDYFLTIYQSEAGTSTAVQSFENFTSMEKINREGWTSTTTATTTSTKKEGIRSLLLKNPIDEVTTEMYQSTVTRLSFWVSAISTDVDTVGVISIDASNGHSWRSFYEVSVPKAMRGKTFDLAVPKDSAYVQFRIMYYDGGGEGVALDAWTVTFDEKITYVAKGRQMHIEDMPGYESYEKMLVGLTPGKDYYCQIQCTDLGKGCEEHVTKLSSPIVVHTIDVPEEDTIMSIGANLLADTTYQYTAYLRDVEEGYCLYIYNLDGHLVWSTVVDAQTRQVVLPEELFVHGQPYILKYSETDKLRRKDIWKKFLYLSEPIQIKIVEGQVK